MEIADEPIAYFITWTVYGTYLHGDSRWWRQGGVSREPRPKLEQWHRDRLKHDIILLSESHRETTKTKIVEHCIHRDWKLWVANPRTNHVHVVVSAPGYLGTKVRDQLKANCTSGLRKCDSQFMDRPVWTTKGDVECIWTKEELERVVQYAEETQGRMGLGK